MSRRRNRKYSEEQKLTAVQAYLNGEGSYKTLQKIRNIKCVPHKLTANEVRNCLEM